MTQKQPRFKFIDRAKDNLLVLVPGWASDYRIFGPLDLEFNYLIPIDFSPLTFEQALLKQIRKKRCKRISVLGWSLGGFLACAFAAKYAELIEQMILVSVRQGYQKQELDQVRQQLSRSKSGFLYKFYHECFFQPKEMSWFRNNLLFDYCRKWKLDYLFQGLDYLQAARISPDLLGGIKQVRIVHGEHDRIAPQDQAQQIGGGLKNVRFILAKDSGHIPFLRSDFPDLLFSSAE